MFDFAPAAPGLPIPLQQSAAFADALNRQGVVSVPHVLPCGQARVILRQTRFLGSVGLVSRGPVWSSRWPTAHFKRVLGLALMRAALGVDHLVVNAETPDDAALLARAGFFRIARPARVAMLDLTGSPATWLDRMDGKWRNRLRHGRNRSLHLRQEQFCPDRHAWLFERDARQRSRNRYRALPHDLIAQIARAEPRAAQLFVARTGQQDIAAMLFLASGAMASYQIGWAAEGGRCHSAHNVLLWEAMLAMEARGVTRLDLGLVGRGSTSGLDRFKLGSGAEDTALGGTWAQSAALMPLHEARRWLRRPR